jgi:hypothetical protein
LPQNVRLPKIPHAGISKGSQDIPTPSKFSTTPTYSTSIVWKAWYGIPLPSYRNDSMLYIDFNSSFVSAHLPPTPKAHSNFPRWERTWRVVGSIKSLQELWVWISWHRLNFGPVEEARLLEQLDQVRQLKTFEVSLPALRGKKVKTRYEQLFNITRRG